MPGKPEFTIQEADDIGKRLGVDWRLFDVEQFHKGLNVELEHGAAFPETNVTNDNPILVGKIVLAHLKQFADYYTRLDAMKTDASKGAPPAHYHGHRIRRFFMVAAVIIVIGLPFASSRISVGSIFALVAALGLGILAGLTSAYQKQVIFWDGLVSVCAFVLFEIFAVMFYYSSEPYFFVFSQTLAVMFLITIYYSIKTWRGMLTK